jgi:hypothetical protein
MNTLVAVGPTVQGGWTAQAIVTLFVGIVAILGVGQKWRADRRDHWWNRTQWALGQLRNGEEARTIAIEILDSQVDSRLATAADEDLLDRVMDLVLDDYDEGEGRALL